MKPPRGIRPVGWLRTPKLPQEARYRGRVEEALERQPLSGLTQGLHPLLKFDFDAGEAFQIFQHGRILKL